MKNGDYCQVNYNKSHNHVRRFIIYAYTHIDTKNIQKSSLLFRICITSTNTNTVFVFFNWCSIQVLKNFVYSQISTFFFSVSSTLGNQKLCNQTRAIGPSVYDELRTSKQLSPRSINHSTVQNK